MNILDDPSPPIFSYVGRLKDSRKGLELFLDALAIIWENRPARAFKAWVVGGDSDDKTWAIRSASCRPSLKSRLSSGDLVFWGRLEDSALPEFYSRSTALIVPSFREQFCITAVEAMMCGCPVIAARVGGLQDVIVDGYTGNLFDSGCATSLAGIMLSYLLAPSFPAWLSTNAVAWSKGMFDAATVYPAIESALANRPEAEHKRWHGPSLAQFRKMTIERTLPDVERLLQSEVLSITDLTSSPSISFKASLKNQRHVFVKLYNNRPTSVRCLNDVPHPADDIPVGRERLLLALRLNKQAFFPPIIANDLGMGLIIQEWAEPSELLNFDEMCQYLRMAAFSVQSYDPAPETLQIRNAIRHKLAEIGTLSLGDLAEVDVLAAELHAPLVGGSLRTRRIHPQLELFRLSRFFDLNAFWLPKDYTTRSLAIIAYLLASRIVPLSPIFAHGSLKQEHILTPHSLLCDFDHAGYYCGPVDVAHWIWEYFRRVTGLHPGVMFRQLQKELIDDDEIFLGICWIIVFQLNRDIFSLSRGDTSPAHGSLPFLYEFAESFRDFGSTR